MEGKWLFSSSIFSAFAIAKDGAEVIRGKLTSCTSAEFDLLI